MKPYKPLFESVADSVADFSAELQSAVQKIFPKSYVSVKFAKQFYASMTLYFALGANKSEYENGYIENDPAYTIISIDGVHENDITRDGQIVGPLSVKMLQGGIYTKPEPGSFNALGRIRVDLRKTSGMTPEKTIAVIEKYFLRLKQVLKDNQDSMTDYHLQHVKDKF